MSSTFVASSSPSQTYLRSPRFSGTTLTYLSSPPARARAANGGDTAPPPPKRQKVDRDPSVPSWTTPEEYDRCMKDQFVPLVNKALDLLPQDRVDTLSIGRKITEVLLKDPNSHFWAEYRRGRGVLGHEFEQRLARQMVAHSEVLARRPEYQRPPTETPVPIPQFHASTLQRLPAPRLITPQVSQSPRLYTPRVSTTPIPIPCVPTRAVGPSSTPTLAAGVASDPIVIDDEEDQAAAHVQRVRPLRLAQSKATSSAAPARKEHPPKPLLDPLLPQRHQAVVSATQSQYFDGHLPYVLNKHRSLILKGNHGVLQPPLPFQSPAVFHVDFTDDEVRLLHQAIRQLPGLPSWRPKDDQRRDLGSMAHQLFRHDGQLKHVLAQLGQQNPLPKRRIEDIRNFLYDLDHKRKRMSTAQKEPVVLSFSQDNNGDHGKFIRASRVESLLFRREISGPGGLRAMRQLVNFKTGFKHSREDELALRAEWTDCAGDIATIAWTSNNAFICGTTEHSDAHNQQYNKPGNLVLGSCSLGTLRAYPEHRIVRPIVSKGENSTYAMQQSQSPWLYSSVVASDYDAAHDRAFTSGFDRTVKIWRVDSESGSSMHMLGEWKHSGNVNFVTASNHASGMIATAADVATDAVRIYGINNENISASPFRSYSCSRVTDAEGNAVSTEKWAYFPATMQWGLAQEVRHLLLVGYSPRSRTGDDNDIPVERLNSGELCLWNGLTGERWKINAATTQNVFEVLWHPSQRCFIAATSPQGLDVPPLVRTQIRIFCSTDEELGEKSFSPVKVLDCRAADINELTFMPNSAKFCYVTAGCTDGNTYVWDTARGDRPILVLRHGESVEPLSGDRESEDVGVKFTAWGTTLDRFYTGSSDGLVKVWNIRSVDKPLVRTLLEAPAPISCGMFSPDKTKLVIGDASGRVFMLSIDEEDTVPPVYRAVKLPNGTTRTVREPLSVKLHDDLPPPSYDAEGTPLEPTTGVLRGQAYLQNGQLQRHPNPTIGVVQGPRYVETGLFRAEAHFENDITQPLLAEWEVKQKDARAFSGRAQAKGLRPVRDNGFLAAVHNENRAVDFNLDQLDWETLQAEGPIMELDYDFSYEDD
ncbi:hypothetical protein OQA88_11403 [Cercophora sp. LCS_1]